MLSFFFALMVLPGTDGRVDKTAKEEDKADEQDGTYIKAQQDKMVNSSLCKKASVDTYFNVMEVNLIIYNDDVIMMN